MDYKDIKIRWKNHWKEKHVTILPEASTRRLLLPKVARVQQYYF
jgi:hypothetical protein